jgi:hypothetical protein
MPGGKTIIGIIAIGLLAAAFIYAGRPTRRKGPTSRSVATLTGTEEVPPADPAGVDWPPSG